MKVSAQYAGAHFEELLSAADSGEEVEIARPNKPTIKLVFLNSAVSVDISGGRRTLGAGRGELRVPGEDEWSAMDRQLKRQMFAQNNNGRA